MLKEASRSAETVLLSCGFNHRMEWQAGTPLSRRGRVSSQDRVLLGISREEAELAHPGTPAGTLFMFSPPQCRFTRCEQRILELAGGGATDREIATELSITPNAVKERWRSAYGRVSRRAAFVFGPGFARSPGHARGAEKRRRVISFVRDHPAELRPYEPA